jgi:hypothetical protein
MRQTKPLQIYILLMASLLSNSNIALTEEKQHFSRLSQVDRQHMEQQRLIIDDLARRYLGRQLNHSTDNNLSILQELLDEKLVKPKQTLRLQGMGIILGDRLAKDLNMHWIIIEDRYGRSKALRLGTTENLLFPVTMISRRAEVGAPVSTRSIYKKAKDIIQPHIPKGPFQYN